MRASADPITLTLVASRLDLSRAQRERFTNQPPLRRIIADQLRHRLRHRLARDRTGAVGGNPERQHAENASRRQAMRLGQTTRAFAGNRCVRQDRRADTLLHHPPDRLVVVQLDLDLQLDAQPGQQRIHRRPQAVAEDQVRATQFGGGDDAGRAGAWPGHQHHLLFRQPRRNDQPAARQFGQQRQIDAAVDQHLLQPHHAGMHDLQLDIGKLLPHAGEQLRRQHRA